MIPPWHDIVLHSMSVLHCPIGCPLYLRLHYVTTLPLSFALYASIAGWGRPVRVCWAALAASEAAPAES